MMSILSQARFLISRLSRKGEQMLRNFRRKFGLFKTVSGNPRARIGIYVAYYDAAWIYEDHLRCIRDLSAGPFNYYVMANCTTTRERRWLDRTIEKFAFPIPFYPWSKSPVLSHGESLQRMIEATEDEIVVLCDVDAFPIRYGWDDYVVERLADRDVVAVVVDMPDRDMPAFLHPSFMAIRRTYLVENGLDVLAGEGNDPAYRITKHLQASGRLTSEHVAPLFPTNHEVAIYPQGRNSLFGRSNLEHGFGTTYADLIFHFWFGRHVARGEAPVDPSGKIVVSVGQMEQVINETIRRVREQCAVSRASKDGGNMRGQGDAW